MHMNSKGVIASLTAQEFKDWIGPISIPCVLVVEDTLSSLVFGWWRYPVVFVRKSDLGCLFSEDSESIDKHFILQNGQTSIATALWLAYFKLRNQYRMNRASLYLQGDLVQKHGVHTLGDFVSKQRGGWTRQEMLSGKLEYQIVGSEVESEDDADDFLRVFEAFVQTQKIKTAIPVHLHMFNTHTNILPVLLKTSKSKDAVHVIVLVTADTSDDFTDWMGVERTWVVRRSILQNPIQLFQELQDFLDFHLPVFSRVVTAESSDNPYLQRRVKDIQHSIRGAKYIQKTQTLSTLRRALISLQAYRDTLELAHASIPQEDGSWIFGDSTRVFGTGVHRLGKLKVSYAARNSHKNFDSEPILGNDTRHTLERSDTDTEHANGLVVVALPNCFQPKIDTQAFHLEDSDSSRNSLLDASVERQYSQVTDAIYTDVLDCFRKRKEESAFRFCHFMATMPLIRTAELQAYLTHLCMLTYSPPTNRSLFRVQLEGVLDEARAEAWARGVYFGQSSLGGIGTEVAEAWCNPQRQLTDKSDTEIAQSTPEWFTSPLERHLRMKKILSEQDYAGLNAYLTALSQSIVQPLRLKEKDGR